MTLLKLIPKVPTAKKQAPIPRAIKKPDKPKAVRSLAGLSREDIEKATEKEYIDRGAILLRFESTSIRNFKLSVDGRFGLRHNEKLRFFQLFHFKEKQSIETFKLELTTYESIKWLESEQIHFYYNDKNITADMQMREIARHISSALGKELEEMIEIKRREYYETEDAINATKFEASILHEELFGNLGNGEEETISESSSEVEEIAEQNSFSSTKEDRNKKVSGDSAESKSHEFNFNIF